MDAISDPLVREVVVMKSAQVGWTELLLNVIGYHVDQDPAPILLIQPTLEMAEAFSKDRLAPMLRDTPALRDKVADPRSRDSGNTLLHKVYPGGRLTIAGANSPAGLASRPIRVVLFDEVDRFPMSAGAEGDPITLGIKRSATFWNRKVLLGSTPTIKGSSRIEVAFEQSDQGFYFVPCPHCAEFQRLVWANVRWPEGRPDLAVYVCAHCGATIDESHKADMIAAGEWRSTRPSTGIAGFHISELYSPWSTWAGMAEAFLRAKALPDTLRAWINTALGETWEERGSTVEAGDLVARRESYGTDAIPSGVQVVTAGVDVQDDRLEVSVYGFGRLEEAWRLEHRVLRGDPASPVLWDELDDVLRRTYRTDDGRELGIEAACVDSGGHYTEQVYRFCQARKRRRVWAIKGAAGARPVWPKKPGRGRGVRVDLFLVGVDTVKDVLLGRLSKVAEPGPGYIHFDRAVDEDYLEQLTAETVVYRVSQGRRVRQWQPRRTGLRTEALDCTVYAYAAFIGRGGQDLTDKRASAAPGTLPVEPPPPPAAEPPIGKAKAAAVRKRVTRGVPRSGWVKKW